MEVAGIVFLFFIVYPKTLDLTLESSPRKTKLVPKPKFMQYTLAVGFTGCQTCEDHQCHHFHRLDNSILWKIPACVIYGYGYQEEEETSFQIV